MILKIGSTDDLPKAAAAILESLDGRSRGFPRRNGSRQDDVDPYDLRALGVTDTVTSRRSPSSANIAERDPAGISFRFYRIDRIEEAFDFGYEEYFYGGDLCLVEVARIERLAAGRCDDGTPYQ